MPVSAIAPHKASLISSICSLVATELRAERVPSFLNDAGIYFIYFFIWKWGEVGKSDKRLVG